MRNFAKFISIEHPAKMRGLLIAIVIGVTSACTTAPRNISEPFRTGPDGGYLTDAKSRVIISQDPSAASRPGAIYPRRITCVEPHPDVASTVANSLGVQLSILGKGSGSISKSQAEGLAQIAQRTVSIQALQRLMFRACEAYANGGITGTGYSLLLSEINKTMVTLILAETAGARFGQSGAAIGGKSFATTSATVRELEGKLKELQASQDTLSEATDKLQDSTENAKTTDDTAKADKTVTPPEADAIDEANQQVKEDSEELADATERMQSAINAVTGASTEIFKVEGLGQRDVKPNAEVASVLATMQDNFLSTGNTQNYISACLIELGMGSNPSAYSPDLPLEYKVAKLQGILKDLEKLRAKETEFKTKKTKLEGTLTTAEQNRERLTKELQSIEENLQSTKDTVKQKEQEITDTFQSHSTSNLVAVQTAAKDALEVLAKGKEMSPGNLRAFVYKIYHLNRKTGLFAHCYDHLETYLAKVEDLKQKDMEHNASLKKKMVDAAVAVASALQDGDAAMFAFCHLLQDAQLRRECVGNLAKLSPPSKKKPADTPGNGTKPKEPPPKVVKDDLPKTVSDAQQNVKTLEAFLPKLTVQLSKLNAFKGDKIKAPSHANPEKLSPAIKKRFDELVDAQAGLKKSLASTTADGDLVHSTVTKHISTAPAKLDALLKSYNDDASERNRADAEARKQIDANIESYTKQAMALALLTKTRVTELEKAIKDVTALVAQIEQHNAAVATFKTS